MIRKIAIVTGASRLKGIGRAILASEEAEWITGQIINSEGGFMRSN